MPGLLVAILLISSLLLVHFSIRSQPMPQARPLDVDEGLPLPEAGQASTVFSLSALFGAYFGIASVLGMTALTGLAFGTVVGLFLVRRWISRRQPQRFEEFLFSLFQGEERNAVVYAMMLSLVQCAYAGSELLILREVAKTALGLKSEQATLVAIGVAIIGYFYVLMGGYMAVFRTDVLQFMLVGIMALASSVVLLIHHEPIDWSTRLLPRAGYWAMPLTDSKVALYVYHFAIAAVMGFGLMSASPDTWKRVFQVNKRKSRPARRFVTFVVVGLAPYLVLLPFVLSIGPIPDGPLQQGLVVLPALSSNLVFIAAALGLVASFLSSFDSALLASVHVVLMIHRRKSRVDRELSRFHWLMVAALLAIFFLFLSLYHFGNVYLLANFLMGAYAFIGGLHIGTRGDISRLPDNSLLWLAVLGTAAWIIYFVSEGLPDLPTTYQLNTVPGAVLLCVVIALLSQILLRLGDKRNARLP